MEMHRGLDAALTDMGFEDLVAQVVSPTHEQVREGNTSKGFEDFSLKNGSSQGQNLAVSGFLVPSSLVHGLFLS